MTGTSPSKGRILVIEDNADNSRLVEKILGKSGYACVVITNAREALMRIPEERPDLILMDMSLPGLDGFEATRLIKSNDRFRAIPVVALTAHAMNEHREKAAEAGCDAYVAKPFRSAELLALISRLLSARAAEHGAQGKAKEE